MFPHIVRISRQSLRPSIVNQLQACRHTLELPRHSEIPRSSDFSPSPSSSSKGQSIAVDSHVASSALSYPHHYARNFNKYLPPAPASFHRYTAREPHNRYSTAAGGAAESSDEASASPRFQEKLSTRWHQLSPIPHPFSPPSTRVREKGTRKTSTDSSHERAPPGKRLVTRPTAAEGKHGERWGREAPHGGRGGPEGGGGGGGGRGTLGLGDKGSGEKEGGGWTALQWAKKCCPEVSHGLLQKLFRKRQVRALLPGEAGTLQRAEEREQEGEQEDGGGGERLAALPAGASSSPPGFHLKRVSEDEWMPPGAVVCLPKSVLLGSLDGGGAPAANCRAAKMPSKDEIAWLRGCVLYKDDHMIVLNKPPGLASQGGSGVVTSVDSLMGHALAYDYPEGPRLVHRLDKETSGAMLLARTAASAAALGALLKSTSASASAAGQQQHQQHQHQHQHQHQQRGRAARRPRGMPGGGPAIQKVYWALVAGEPKRRSGRIDVPLCKVTWAGGSSDRTVVAAESQVDKSQSAVTEYRVLGSHAGLTWLELTPLTGRKHQLRVHCASVLKLPIVGDTKYGAWACDMWQPFQELRDSNAAVDHDLNVYAAPEAAAPAAGAADAAGAAAEAIVSSSAESGSWRGASIESDAHEGATSPHGTGALTPIAAPAGVSRAGIQSRRSCGDDDEEEVEARLGGVHRSIFAASPSLHLHCRELRAPRTGVGVDIQEDSGEGGAGHTFKAPLPPHMRESWTALHFF